MAVVALVMQSSITVGYFCTQDSVKAQFDQRQSQVKETIQKLKSDFELKLQERDMIHRKKMERLERQKNAGLYFVMNHCILQNLALM